MNLNPFKVVYKFNKQAGLLDRGYNDQRECAFPIEEALEGFDLTRLTDRLGFVGVKDNLPRDLSRVVMDHIDVSMPLSDRDILDKHIDIIVYSLGSIYKLGLTPQQTMRALGVVANKNLEKLSVGADEYGKQMKPSNFIGPEEELQKILDER